MQNLIKIIIFNAACLSMQAICSTAEKHLNLNDYKKCHQTSPLLTQRAAINYGACAITPEISRPDDFDLIQLTDGTIPLTQSERNSIDKLNLLRGALAHAERRFEDLHWLDCCHHCILAHNLQKSSLAAIDENLDELWIPGSHNSNFGTYLLTLSIPLGITTWPRKAFNMLGIPYCISDTTTTALACCSLMSAMPSATYKYARDTKGTAKRHLRLKLHDLNDLLRRVNQAGIN